MHLKIWQIACLAVAVATATFLIALNVFETPRKQGDAGVSLTAKSFDGNNATRKVIKLGFPGDYVIDTKLRSAPPPAGATRFTKTTPPMPFVIGDIAISQLASSYQILIGRNPKPIMIARAQDWQHVRIEVRNNREASVWLGPDLIWTGPFKSRREQAKIHVGVGYFERRWKGEMEWLIVYQGSVTGSMTIENEKGQIIPTDFMANPIFTLG